MKQYKWILEICWAKKAGPPKYLQLGSIYMKFVNMQKQIIHGLNILHMWKKHKGKQGNYKHKIWAIGYLWWWMEGNESWQGLTSFKLGRGNEGVWELCDSLYLICILF